MTNSTLAFHSFPSCLVTSGFTFISCVPARYVNDSSRLSRVSPCPQVVHHHRLSFCFSHDSVPKFRVPVCLNLHSRSFLLLYPCPLHPIRYLFVLLFLLLTGYDSVPKLSVPVCPFLQDLLSFVSFTHYSSVRCLIRLNQDFVFVGALFICVCHSTRHRLFFLRGEVSYGIPSVHMSHSNTAAITP